MNTSNLFFRFAICPQLLSEAIIHECIQRLLKSLADGESLECFAKLMTTIGKELDHGKGQVSTAAYVVFVSWEVLCCTYVYYIHYSYVTCVEPDGALLQ